MTKTIPMFRQDELVKDKFGNIFKILEVDSIGDDDTCMHYNLELVTKVRNSLDRPIGTHLKFKQPGDSFWIYDTEEDAKDDRVKVTNEHLFATELKLYEADKTEAKEVEIPMFDQGDLVKDKFGNIFKIITMLAPQYFEQDSFEYDEMGYLLKLIDKAPNTRDREVGDGAVFHREGDEYWIYNTEADIRSEDYEVTPETIVATELVLFEKSEEAEETNDSKPAKAELTKRYPSIEDLQKMSEENDLGKLLDQAYAILKEQASLGERNANLPFEKFKRCIPHFEQEGFEVLEHGVLINVRW